MRVLVLVPTLYDTSPGQRFRIEQWARQLENDGFRFEFMPFEDESLHRVIYQRARYVRKSVAVSRALARRFAVLSKVRQFDVVFLFREAALVGPAIVERLITRSGVPMVYDFDDPVWLSYRSPTNGAMSWLKFAGKTKAICRLADRVIVGNRLLAGWAGKYAALVDVIPSTIDHTEYAVRPETKGGGRVTLGWTGSHSTLPFLQQIGTPLKALAARYQLRLVVVSHTNDFRLESVPIKICARRWRSDTEAEDLHDIDIGLAPFPNEGWTPWRCHGKVLQYMAAGIPCVASRIGVLPEYIRDGENGFLADTEEEWHQKIAALIENENMRRRMGLAGRRTIEEKYSARVWAPRVREVLEAAAGGQFPPFRPGRNRLGRYGNSAVGT